MRKQIFREEEFNEENSPLQLLNIGVHQFGLVLQAKAQEAFHC